MSKTTPHILRMVKMAFVVTALIVAAAAAAATESPAETDATTILSSTVELGGVTLFRFVEPFKDVSPQERVSIIYQRLWYVLDSTVPERRLELRDQVRVDKIRADMCIFVGDYLIVTIDEVHARINRCSPQELAEVWADNLRRGLSRYLEINAPKALYGG